MPSRARLYVGSPISGVPSKTMSPDSGRSCPQTQLNRVVLPAPLGPTRPTLSPGAHVEGDAVHGLDPAEGLADAAQA